MTIDIRSWVNNEFNTISESYLNVEEMELLNYSELEEYHDGEYFEYVPMWGYYFEVTSSVLEEIIRDNLEEVTTIGFHVFEHEVTGNILLGIDGAGYDFYEAHWEPLHDLYMR